MCLFPMGQMGPAPAGTALAKKLKSWCYILILVHAGLALFLMFSGGGDAVFSGIFELIICLVLYCGASQYNFCCVLYYMIMALLNIVTRFSFLGFLVQVKIQGTMIDWS